MGNGWIRDNGTPKTCPDCGGKGELNQAQEKPPIEQQIREERENVYGPPKPGHTNIGLAWTAHVQAFYGITFDRPFPPELVAQMMASLKLIRAARTYHADNYVDARNYLNFADEFQRPKQTNQPEQKP